MPHPLDEPPRPPRRARRLPLSPRPLTEPRPSRLPLDAPLRAAVLQAHGEALAEGRDSYLDPATGFVVLTARFLADRETCCGSGCRHCPYVDGPHVDGP